MKKIIFISAMLLMIIETNAQSYSNGITLLQYQRYNSAIENFKGILQQNPDNAEALFWLSEAFLKNKEVEKTNEYLNAISPEIKNNPLIKIINTRLLFAQNKKAQAEKILNQKIYTDTTSNINSMQCLALGKIYVEMGKFILAKSFLLRALTLDPINPYILVQLGQISLKISDGSAAYKYFTKSLDVEPEYPAANFWLGKLFKSQDNPSVYLPYFNKVVKKDSLFAAAWYELYRYAYFNEKGKTKFYYNKYLETADKTEKQEFQLLELDYINKKYSKVITKGTSMLADDGSDLPSEIYKYLAYSYYATNSNALAYSNMVQYMEMQDSMKITAFDNYLLAQFATRITKKDSLAIKIITNEYYRDTSSKNKYYYAAKLYNYYIGAKDYYNINVWKQNLLQFKNNNKTDMYKVGLNWLDLNELGKADSIFSTFVLKYPASYEGIYMQAVVKAKIDSNSAEGLAIPYFTNFLDSIKTIKTANYSIQVKQALAYVGSYYLAKKDYETALVYYQKLLLKQPNNTAVRKAVTGIKKYLKEVKVYEEKKRKADK